MVKSHLGVVELMKSRSVIDRVLTGARSVWTSTVVGWLPALTEQG